MAKIVAIFLLTLSLGLSVPSSAQNLDMSGSDQSSTFDAAGKPTRGMTQASVEANFGNPRRTANFPLGICRLCGVLRV